MADLVREGVDHLLRENGGTSRRDLMHRAAGAFRSGSGDGAARHDEHFAGAVVRTR